FAERLVGEQSEYRHGDRRHAAASGRLLPAWTILHTVKNIHQTHNQLLLRHRTTERPTSRQLCDVCKTSAGPDGGLDKPRYGLESDGTRAMSCRLNRKRPSWVSSGS